jgi:hypothetical protein
MPRVSHPHGARRRRNQGEFVDSIRLSILSSGSITIPTARNAYHLLREHGVV